LVEKGNHEKGQKGKRKEVMLPVPHGRRRRTRADETAVRSPGLSGPGWIRFRRTGLECLPKRSPQWKSRRKHLLRAKMVGQSLKRFAQ